MAAKPSPKITVARHEGFRTIFPTGMYGGPRASGYIEYVVYTDESMPDKALATIQPDASKAQIRRTLQCRLVLTPIEAKSLTDLLQTSIRKYEQIYGEIVLPKEEKGKKPPPSPMIS